MSTLLLFCVFAFLALAGGFLLLLTKRVFHAAYALLLSLLSVAVLLLLTEAHTAAAAQILVYAGGVVVLLLFGALLSQSSPGGTSPAGTYNRLNGTLLTAALLAVLVYGVSQMNLSRYAAAPAKPAGYSQLKNIGIELLTGQLVPFEVAGLLLLAALLGAAAVAALKKG